MSKKIITTICLFLTIFLFSGCGIVPKDSSNLVLPAQTFSKNIWISRDGGKTWKESNIATAKPRVKEVNPLILVFDPKDENVAYFGLKTGGIIKTVNGGESWEFISLNTEKVYGLAIDPNDSRIMYAGTVIGKRGKIFKNINAGLPESWNEIYASATAGLVVTYIAIDQKNSQIVYATTSDNQIIKSIDGGISWRNIFSTKSPVVKIAFDSKNNNLIYCLTKSGEIFFTPTGEDKFETLAINSKEKSSVSQGGAFSILETDPSVSGLVYLAGKSGILRSRNSGKEWENVITLNNPQNSPISGLTINPKTSQEITYSAGQATYKSIDDGRTWSTLQFDLPRAVSILKYNPLNSNIIYAVLKTK